MWRARNSRNSDCVYETTSHVPARRQCRVRRLRRANRGSTGTPNLLVGSHATKRDEYNHRHRRGGRLVGDACGVLGCSGRGELWSGAASRGGELRGDRAPCRGAYQNDLYAGDGARRGLQARTARRGLSRAGSYGEASGLLADRTLPARDGEPRGAGCCDRGCHRHGRRTLCGGIAGRHFLLRPGARRAPGPC